MTRHTLFIPILVGISVGLPSTFFAATPSCATPPSGLVSWWPFEGDGSDSADGNPALLMGGPQFVPGLVGQALGFDGANDYASVDASASLDVGSGAGLTLEGWINPSDLSHLRPIAEWNNERGSVGAQFWTGVDRFVTGDGVRSLYVNLLDTQGVDHQLSSPAGVLSVGVYQHVAMTYDKASGVTEIYHDGVRVALTNLGTFTPQTSYPLHFGLRPSAAFSGIYFVGAMDEFGLYDRALTAGEIASIHQAGSQGKCRDGDPPQPPSILAQPEAQTVSAGVSVSFSVTATGTEPLSYQWRKDGAVLDRETSPTLVLSDVQPDDAGLYSVVVRNTAGMVTSSGALLTVTSSNCAPPPSGLVSWWPFEGDGADVADGNPTLLMGGPQFPPGLVGQALGFDGANDYASVDASASLDVGSGAGLTLEGWINPSDLSHLRPIAEWNNERGSVGAQFWTGVDRFVTGDGVRSLYVNLLDTQGIDHQAFTAAGLLSVGGYQHVAMSYDKASGVAAIYHDGIQVALTNLGTFTPQTTYPLHFGLRPSAAFSGIYFVGAMDEFSLYDRALSAGEIASIHAAGSQGKCLDRAPVADARRTMRTVISPNNKNATVVLDGTASSNPNHEPLTYTWFRGDAAVPLATGATSLVTLPIGKHHLRLVVDDGTTSDATTIRVEVITLSEATERLLHTVSESGVGKGRSLSASVAAALASINRHHEIPAINQLRAFQHKVRIQLAPELAEHLVRQAQQIIAQLQERELGSRKLRVVKDHAHGKMKIKFKGTPGRIYVIEASTDMVHWRAIGVANLEGDDEFGFDDPEKLDHCFYRVVEP